MKCEKCGMENNEGSKFCSFCGEKIEIKKDDVKNPPALEPSAREKKPSNDKWVVVALIVACIVLPPLGIICLFVAKKPKNKIARGVLVVFLLFYSIGSYIPSDSESDEADTTQLEVSEKDDVKGVDEPKEEIESESTKESENKKDESVSDKKEKKEKKEEKKNDFLTIFSRVVGEDVANGANDVLVNQIGFSELEYEQRLGDTSNYEIIADGTDMVITAMQDYYRVFIPNTSNVFYEDGEVLMTAEEYNDKKISYDDAIVYYIMAQEIIEQNLVNPKSADFPSMAFSGGDIGFAKTGDVITVQSYVDAKNSFNAVVRSNWTVQFIPIDMTTYTYETTYINIDGNTTGTYTETK